MLPLGFATGSAGTRFAAGIWNLRQIPFHEEATRMAATGRHLSCDRNSVAPAATGFASRSVDTFLPVWTQKDIDLHWTINAGGGYWITPAIRTIGSQVFCCSEIEAARWLRVSSFPSDPRRGRRNAADWIQCGANL